MQPNLSHVNPWWRIRGGGSTGPDGHLFLSTFEKQLDSKRRIVVPQEFRAAAASSFDGVFCFPSIEADCLEGGGKALFDRYEALIEELPFGDPLRSSLEFVIFGGMYQLAFDAAGRITLPEKLCEQFGLSDWVAVVGLKDRFQIWERDRYHANREAQREAARVGLVELRHQQRARNLGGAA